MRDIHDKSLSRGRKLSRRASALRRRAGTSSLGFSARLFSSRLRSLLETRTRHPFAASAPKGRRRSPRPPIHCCVTKAIVVVPVAVLSLIRESSCKRISHPTWSPTAGPAHPDPTEKCFLEGCVGRSLRQALHAKVAIFGRAIRRCGAPLPKVT